MVLSSIASFSKFHDARIGKIYYDYGLKSMLIDLLMDSSAFKGQTVLKGTNVILVQFQSMEPWGQGIYVESLDYINKRESGNHYIGQLWRFVPYNCQAF